MRTALPTGFHEQRDGTVVCPHRDLSCCKECRGTDERLVEVSGVTFFLPDPADRAELAILTTEVSP